jgi:hypothetical protein
MQPSTIEIDRPVVSAAAIGVRDARFSDYEAIASLMHQYGMETSSREDWEQLWLGNPVYQRRAEDWPIGWVLENSDERVVGFSGNIPAECSFSEKRLTAAVTSAWVVGSEYRSHSMLLASKYFAQKKVDLLLNTTAIHVAGQIFRAFHAKPIPAEGLETALFWVLDYRGFALSSLARKGVPLAAIAKYPAAAALAVASRLKSGGTNRERPSTREPYPAVKSVENFDGRFDSFWLELKERSSVLLSVRDRETLSWHFRRSLKAKGLWIFINEIEGRLTSYAIFQRQDKSDVGLTRMRLVDFQSLDPDPSVLNAMIAAALSRAKETGVQMLEVVGFSGEVRARLENLAPFRRTLPSQLFYYKAMNKELKAQLANPQAWQPSSYDGDSSL